MRLPPRPTRLPLLLAILTAAIPAAAQESLERQVANAVPSVEAAVGLPFKRPPRVEGRSRAEMRAVFSRMFDKEPFRSALAGEETVYRRLGIIPDTLDWRALQLGLLAEQVVGYYDPATKLLYLESDAEEQALGIVIAHELVHALQDQYVNLDSIAHLQGEDDRVLAAEAVMEGQATLLSFEAALGFGPEFPEGAEAIRESVREERSEQPVMRSAPFFVQELQIFPYLYGLEFMVRFQRQRPERSPFGDALPASTTQILHPEAYFGAAPRAPLTVRLRPAGGVTFAYDAVMGEFATRVYLEQLLRDKKRAARASAGWSGDRLALVRSGKADGVAWLSVWESRRDAEEFADAMRRVVARRYVRPRARTEGDTTTFDAGDRVVTVRLGRVAGHASVYYEDMPAGWPTGIVSDSAARVE